ncbi:MAG: PDZ domain-containing protein [Candidatus Eremiobacteraeota bacterium]|nr:PDZ domain-containing protein [Candidatus Eremiobacteraeota bacterium]
MKHILVGLIACAAFVSGAQAAAIPTPSSTVAPLAGPSASPTAALSPSPPAIVPPRDAPAVRSTTPPLGAATVRNTPPAPNSIWLGDSQTIVVPITMHGERPFIQALIDGHPATLLIDTAAIATTIDPGAMERAATGAISLQIGEVRFPRLQPVRANIWLYSETTLGARADGVIGRDLLQRYPIGLDFPNQTLTIFRDSRGAAAAQPAGAVSLALRVIDGLPAISASLDGQTPLWFGLGTGASYQVRLAPWADHASHYAHSERSLPFQESAPLNDASGLLVRARSLSVGSLSFNQPLVALLNTPRGQAGSQLAGMLGAMTLSRLNLFIDELSPSAAVFAPAGATAARFYNPSGIAVVMHHGAIVVRSVVHGTPADEAHVRPGDELIAINGFTPTTLDFARQALDGHPGTKVAIAYRRWRVVHYATLTLHVII